MKWLCFFFLVLGFAKAEAQQAGFSEGATFIASAVDGQVSMTCNFGDSSHSGNVQFNCHDVVLEPARYDYFVGPHDTAASSVTLVATHADGSTRSKTVDYDGASGKSTDAFNLWISTLFQRPLLSAGTNTIAWSLSGDVVKTYEHGTFTVTVVHGQPRHCKPLVYVPNSGQDCDSQYTVCQHYFEQLNNCKAQ